MENKEFIPEWATKKETIITCRDYETVLKGLRVPDSYFVKGEKILSVGEGFSDFSRKLHEEKGVDSIAVDPIYEAHGKVIKNKDGKEEKLNLFQKDSKKVTEALNKFYGESVRFDFIKGKETIGGIEGEVPLPDPERSVAASVYKLPFPDNHFDKIVSYRVFEHIDFSKALPELIRVLKENGEIRMAALNLSVFPSEKKLLPSLLEFDFDGMSASWINHAGLGNSLDLMINDNSISNYVLVDDYHKAKMSGFYPNIRKGTILITRKDKNWPKVNDKKDKDPYVGKIMKIIKEKPKMDIVSKQPYYSLSFNSEEEKIISKEIEKMDWQYRLPSINDFEGFEKKENYLLKDENDNLILMNKNLITYLRPARNLFKNSDFYKYDKDEYRLKTVDDQKEIENCKKYLKMAKSIFKKTEEDDSYRKAKAVGEKSGYSSVWWLEQINGSSRKVEIEKDEFNFLNTYIKMPYFFISNNRGKLIKFSLNKDGSGKTIGVVTPKHHKFTL